MPPKFSKRLVIDADVAQASGGKNATHPTSKHCRDFLETVRKTGHSAVMTQEISAEWQKHESQFARLWRVAMQSQKKIHLAKDTVNSDLRNQINGAAASGNARKAMLKDVILIEAAMAADKTVISLDETSRRLFAAASESVSELEDVVWVNPGNSEEEKPIFWLKNGAWPEKKRRLGFRATKH